MTPSRGFFSTPPAHFSPPTTYHVANLPFSPQDWGVVVAVDEGYTRNVKIEKKGLKKKKFGHPNKNQWRIGRRRGWNPLHADLANRWQTTTSFVALLSSTIFLGPFFFLRATSIPYCWRTTFGDENAFTQLPAFPSCLPSVLGQARVFCGWVGVWSRIFRKA